MKCLLGLSFSLSIESNTLHDLAEKQHMLFSVV